MIQTKRLTIPLSGNTHISILWSSNSDGSSWTCDMSNEMMHDMQNGFASGQYQLDTTRAVQVTDGSGFVIPGSM